MREYQNLTLQHAGGYDIVYVLEKHEERNIDILHELCGWLARG
jgi:hypothetical protein